MSILFIWKLCAGNLFKNCYLYLIFEIKKDSDSQGILQIGSFFIPNGEKNYFFVPVDLEMIRISEALETEYFFFWDASFTLVRFLT
jgi:hypothetical protein